MTRPILLALAVGSLATPWGAAGQELGIRLAPAPNAAGIDLVMTSGRMPSREILEVNGGGVALFDFDGDGDLDVFLANGATLAQPDRGPGSRLYSNRGDGTFEDATEAAGVDLRRWAMGVAVGDYDGDGWDDVYVTCFGANALLRNSLGEDGGRRFVDVGAAAGVAGHRWSTSAAFADLDGDRDLDLYVVDYLEFDPTAPPERAGHAFKGMPVMAGPRGLEPQPDVVYENLGDGTFRDVTAAAGGASGSPPGYGLGVRALDLDGDGRQDLFVGNDSTADHLLSNVGASAAGDLALEDRAVVAGVATNGRGTPQATMGIALADVDGNGFPDLFVSVFSDDTNTLHLNLGDGFFDDRSAQYGLAAASRPYLGWGCGFYDFDLDGDEDLYVANGHVYPEMDDPEVGGAWALPPLLFERRGARFEAADCTAPWCRRRYHGRATAFGDLDGDLDVDVLMTTLNGPLLALRNDAEPSRALAVRLRGPAGNPRALGSAVALTAGDATQRRWITGGGSYQSADATDAYFGLGATAEATPLALRVRWPDGALTEITSMPADALLVLPAPSPSTRRVEP